MTIYSIYYIRGETEFVWLFTFERESDIIKIEYRLYDLDTIIIPPYEDFNDFMKESKELLKNLALIIKKEDTVSIKLGVSSFQIKYWNYENFKEIQLFFNWFSSADGLEIIETISVYDDVIYDKNNPSQKHIDLFEFYFLKNDFNYFMFTIKLDKKPVISHKMTVFFKREAFERKINITALKYVELVIKRIDLDALTVENGYIDLSSFFENYERNDEIVKWIEVNTPSIEKSIWIKVEAASSGKEGQTSFKLVSLELQDKKLAQNMNKPKPTYSDVLNKSKGKYIVGFFLLLITITGIWLVILKSTKKKTRNFR